jgi:hypothetical protein
MRWFACLALIATGCSSGGGYVPRRDGGPGEDLAGPSRDLAGPHDFSMGGSDMPLTSSCTDGIKNGSETDVDCGGGSCPPCLNGARCVQPSDCQSFVCQNGLCDPAASCTDGIKNGSETDVDCGGGSCPACPNGKHCTLSTDCQSLMCTNGLCSAGGNFTHSDGFGDSWTDATPTGTFTQAEALKACNAYVQKHAIAFTCADCGGGCTSDPCVYYQDTVNTPYVWFYGTGTERGQTSANCCIDNSTCFSSGSWN